LALHCDQVMTKRFIGLFLPALALGSLLGGCPREPEAPEPGMGTPCEQLSDCNPEDSCGALTLCVDGFCEQDDSLIRPCPGEGEPVRPPGRD
jgi:hypothetical protein